jgi:4-amino-4-deoxychorismate lyase
VTSPVDASINPDSIKTTDYSVKSFIASRTKEKGGYLGMFLDNEGNVLECAMANVAFVLPNNEILIPPFSHTVAGTTSIKCIKYLEEVHPEIKIIRELRHIDELKSTAIELMVLGGQKVVPVYQWDEKVLFELPLSKESLTYELQVHMNQIARAQEEERLSFAS